MDKRLLPRTEEHKEAISKALLGHTVSIKTRKKISEANKGRIVSFETRKKLCLAQTGKKYSIETRRKISSMLKKYHATHISVKLGTKQTEETKRKISLAGIGRKHSLATRKKMSLSRKGKKLSDEHKKNISLGQKGKRLSLITREKISKAHKGKIVSLETRKKLSKIRRGKTLSLETRKKISIKLKGIPKSMAHREKSIKALMDFRSTHDNPFKGCKHSQATRQKLSEIQIGKTFSLKIRKKMSLSHKGKQFSEAHLKNILKALYKHPNKFEVRALAYLELIYPGKFSYTGDGSCIINRRSADAMDLKTRTVALFNGTYWHLGKYGLKITDKNKRLREKIEAKSFLDAGYKVIFIWEDELNSLDFKSNNLINTTLIHNYGMSVL